MKHVVVTNSAYNPSWLDEAKKQLRVPGQEFDVEVKAVLAAAIDYCERVSGRVLRTPAVYRTDYRSFAELNKHKRFLQQPVTAIDSVKYYDEDGVLQTLAASNYRLLSSSDSISEIEFVDGFSSPTLEVRTDAVQVQYQAGYSDIEDIPEAAKMAVKLVITWLWSDLSPAESDNYERKAKAILGPILIGNV